MNETGCMVEVEDSVGFLYKLQDWGMLQFALVLGIHTMHRVALRLYWEDSSDFHPCGEDHDLERSKVARSTEVVVSLASAAVTPRIIAT